MKIIKEGVSVIKMEKTFYGEIIYFVFLTKIIDFMGSNWTAILRK